MSAENESPRFYLGDDKDDLRLQYMAAIGIDRISLQGLEVLDLSPDDTVLDIGCGPHPTIGKAIGAVGASYIAFDADPHAVRKQQEAGNTTIHGSAEVLPIRGNSINAVHMRFVGGWLGKLRKQVWQEIFRVGDDDLYVLDIESDWSVAGGHPDYERLLGMMGAVLRPAGFEYNYGAYAGEEITRFARQNFGNTGHAILESRQPIPAETIEEKLHAIDLTVQSLEAKLLENGLIEKAAALRAQMGRLVSAELTADDLRLPDVVSIIFALTNEEQMATDSLRHQQDGQLMRALTLAFSEKDTIDQDLQIWRLRPGWDEHPLGIKGMNFFVDRYTVAKYVDNTGFSPEDFLETIDPKQLRSRSEMFLALGPTGHAESSVRGVYPDEAGLVSLPTGKKVIEKYGRNALPDFFRDESTSEIGFYASTSRNSIVMVRSIVAAVLAAREANMSHILYGSVSGKITEHFNNVFGKGLRPLLVDGEPVTVIVEGPGYTEEGISLTIGYIDTDDFLNDVIEYYNKDKLNNRDASYIIHLCQQLQDHP